MKDRANILARLRRWKSGAARYVVAAFAVAYLSAGVAPCAMAARATEELGIVGQEDHAAHEPRQPVAHAQHGHETHGAGAAAHESVTALDLANEHCSHCPPGAQGDHTTCVALQDLTNVASSHAKDAPQPLSLLLVPAAFMPLPPFAPPWSPPPLRDVRVASVPLNVRHCVFLI